MSPRVASSFAHLASDVNARRWSRSIRTKSDRASILAIRLSMMRQIGSNSGGGTRKGARGAPSSFCGMQGFSNEEATDGKIPNRGTNLRPVRALIWYRVHP